MQKIIFVFFILFSLNASAQLPFNLIDAREDEGAETFINALNDKPVEVLYGTQIMGNGDIYFSTNNIEWFNKFFKNNNFGISVDIVSKDRFGCNNKNNSINLPYGKVIKPVYRDEILRKNNEGKKGTLFVKIGTLPTELKGKEIEDNIIFVYEKKIFFYTYLLDIERTDFELLPMGLFTDTLLKNNNSNSKKNIEESFFTFTKRQQIEIKFPKGSTSVNPAFMKHFFDSLGMNKYNIRKVEIRAYSSIEGSEAANKVIMSQRANAMLEELKKYEPNLTRIKVITAENWLEFFDDIKNSKFEYLKELSKKAIKEKLKDKVTIEELEEHLSKERKAVFTFFLEEKSKESSVTNEAIVDNFNAAVKQNNIQKAKELQKELAERIIDNKLPLSYIYKLEVPKTKGFELLENDNIVYKYLLRATSEYEALTNYLILQKADPTNGKINYNICALKIFLWKNGDEKMDTKLLLNEINNLERQKINKTLVDRILMNFYILKAANDMANFKYTDKEVSVNVINSLYKKNVLTDDEAFALAKYYVYYTHRDWAEEIIALRIGKINASEDLIFYYINLNFFDPNSYETEDFNKAVLNAINLNKDRYCKFFNSISNGGASFQLLGYESIKKPYCEACKNK